MEVLCNYIDILTGFVKHRLKLSRLALSFLCLGLFVPVHKFSGLPERPSNQED